MDVIYDTQNRGALLLSIPAKHLRINPAATGLLWRNEMDKVCLAAYPQILCKFMD